MASQKSGFETYKNRSDLCFSLRCISVLECCQWHYGHTLYKQPTRCAMRPLLKIKLKHQWNYLPKLQSAQNSSIFTHLDVLHTVGTRKWSDVVKGSSGPTNDHNYVGTTPINRKYTNSQNSPLMADRKTTLEQ